MEQESHGDYKRTQQGVSNVFLYYIYYYYKSYSKLYIVHKSTILLSQGEHAIAMPLMLLCWKMLFCERKYSYRVFKYVRLF